MKVLTVGANATAMVKTENQAMQPIRVIRRPIRSVTGPISTAPIPTPTSPTVEAVVSEASVKPRAPVLLMVGITAPITTRSKPSRATASQQRTIGQWPEATGVRRAAVRLRWRTWWFLPERGALTGDPGTQRRHTCRLPLNERGDRWVTSGAADLPHLR